MRYVFIPNGTECESDLELDPALFRKATAKAATTAEKPTTAKASSRKTTRKTTTK